MCRRKTTAFALAPFALAPFALVLVLGVFALARPADAANAADAVPGETSGDGVTPTVESGNSTCADLGYGDYELKVDPPLDGSYTDTDNDIIDFDVQLTGLSDSGAKSFDFLSNMGVDAVLVKGSNSSDIYVYDLTDLTDENKDDTGLSAPRNPDNGQLYGISHIDFC